MTRLPQPGADSGTWGQILNDFLGVEHNSDGTLKTSGSLSTKADDTVVLHKAGTETVTGAKDFTGGITINGTGVVVASDARLTDTRTPTDGTVTDAKVASGANIAQNKIANLTADLAATEKTTNKGQASGYAPLDGSSKVPIANLPVGATSTTVAAGNDSRLTSASTAVQSVNSKTGTSVTLVASDVGAVSVTGGGKETTNTATASTATTTVNLANGNVQMLTLAANTTISLTGATNSMACSLSLYIQQDATGSRTLTWPASVKWPSAAAPVLSTGANKIDLVILETLDGGTTWYGNLAGADYR